MPFFPQELHHCGPAALATALNAEGAGVTPEALAPLVYVPGRQGSFQAELVAAARVHGRVPYRVDPNPEALLAALSDHRPVLVLQNLGLGVLPRWHYAVVVGYDPQRDEWLLRSGRERRQRLSSRRFLRTWDLAERWALVLAAPADPPAAATAARWLQAAAPFESLGRADIAAEAYAAAVARWPDSALAWQAYANARYGQGDLAGAEEALRRALVLEPSVPVRNNLAQVLAERGCAAEAQQMLDAIGDVPPAFADAVADTQRSVLRLGAASGCS